MRIVSRKIIVLVVSLMMVMPFITVQSNAASSVVISAPDNISGGDTFSVNVIFNGDNIGRVSAGLSYDTDQLTYISGGSSQENSGYVDLNLAGTGEAIAFSLKFQAVKDGQTSLDVETHELYDLDEKYVLERPSASKTITINGSAADNQVVTKETSPDKPVEATEPVGVDEMQPKDNNESNGSNVTVILIISALILVLLIVVISVVLAKKKKNDKNNKNNKNNKNGSVPNNGRVGRSGRPLDPEFSDDKKDKAWLDELMGSSNVDRHRDYSKTARRKANEETEVFSDWNLDNQSDDYEDIDKW